MENSKASALAIVALVVGAAGIGVGSFSAIKFQIVEGLPGADGGDGTDGIDGINGTDGIDGIIGTDGIDGTDGTDGIDGTNGTDGIPGSDMIVGIWEGLSGSGVNYNMSLDDIILSNSSYFDLTDGGGINTTLELIKAGWYRFTVKCLWDSLISTDFYNLYIIKNDLIDGIIDMVFNPPTVLYMITTTAYVYSDGDDIFNLYSYSGMGDSFTVYADDTYNQVVLEYLGND